MRSVGLRVVGSTTDELRRSVEQAMSEARKVLRDLDLAHRALKDEMNAVRHASAVLLLASSGGLIRSTTKPVVPDEPAIWWKNRGTGLGDEIWFNGKVGSGAWDFRRVFGFPAT